MAEEKSYRIGDVAKLLKLKPYVLRFWESEFPQIRPIRTDSGQRVYSEADIETLRTIQDLLHERGLTIDGAKRELAADAPLQNTGLIKEVIDELESIRGLLTD